MPSATPGRYQSRLFNFFHQQSRRWGEQFGRTVRHLQVAASWSIEALAYPVYLLIQKALESDDKQLNVSEEQHSPQLQGQETDSQPQVSPSADNAILRVLETVATLQIEDRETNQFQIRKPKFLILNSSLFPHPLALHSPLSPEGTPSSPTLPPSPHPPKMQGVASNLVNRHLVLVTTKNEILDILTPQQQEKLQNRIHDEIYQYCNRWQVNQLQQVEDETKLLPEIDRLLNKLTSGGRDNIPALPAKARTENKIESQSQLPVPLRGIAVLDTAFAHLESSALVPISRTSEELIQFVQTQLNIFLFGGQQLTTSEQEALAAGVKENQTPKILSLIWAAINYFFGEKTDKKLEQTIATNNVSQISGSSRRKLTFNQVPVSSQLQSEDVVDPWLTMSDLFGNSQQRHDEQLTVNNQQSLISQFKSKTQKKAISQGDRTSQVEAKPDWIETNAETIGYVKHPLELLLEWLDRTMLWLEKILVNIFQFLRGLLHKN